MLLFYVREIFIQNPGLYLVMEEKDGYLDTESASTSPFEIATILIFGSVTIVSIVLLFTQK